MTLKEFIYTVDAWEWVNIKNESAYGEPGEVHRADRARIILKDDVLCRKVKRFKSTMNDSQLHGIGMVIVLEDE